MKRIIIYLLLAALSCWAFGKVHGLGATLFIVGAYAFAAAAIMHTLQLISGPAPSEKPKWSWPRRTFIETYGPGKPPHKTTTAAQRATPKNPNLGIRRMCGCVLDTGERVSRVQLPAWLRRYARCGACGGHIAQVPSPQSYTQQHCNCRAVMHTMPYYSLGMSDGSMVHVCVACEQLIGPAGDCDCEPYAHVHARGSTLARSMPGPAPQQAAPPPPERRKGAPPQKGCPDGG